MRIAVTGSTGYIGGRLIPQLLAQGHDVVCLARTPGKLDDLPWRPDVDVRRFDLEDATTVEPALAGCDAAFYLVHAMGASADFAEADRLAAERFATGAAAQEALDFHFKTPHMAKFQQAMAGFGVKEVKLQRYEISSSGPLGG